MKKELPELFERIKKIARIRTEKDLAAVLNISPQDFSKRIRQGTWRSLYPNIIQWAIKVRVSLDWLFKEKVQRIQIANSTLARVETAQKRFTQDEFAKIHGLMLRIYSMLTVRQQATRKENHRIIKAFIDSLYDKTVPEEVRAEIEELFKEPPDNGVNGF